MWDTCSVFVDLSFLPPSPGGVLLLLGSMCTVSLAAGEGLRTLFLWIWLGKEIWFWSHEAQVHPGFKYTCILFTLEILIAGRMTKNPAGGGTDAQLGMTEKLPYWFESVFSHKITYINSHPDFCWMCETCISNVIFWLLEAGAVLSLWAKASLVPYRINWSCCSVALCMPLVQGLWCQFKNVINTWLIWPFKETWPNKNTQNPRTLLKMQVSFAKYTCSMSITLFFCSLKKHPVYDSINSIKKTTLSI